MTLVTIGPRPPNPDDPEAVIGAEWRRMATELETLLQVVSLLPTGGSEAIGAARSTVECLAIRFGRWHAMIAAVPATQALRFELDGAAAILAAIEEVVRSPSFGAAELEVHVGALRGTLSSVRDRLAPLLGALDTRARGALALDLQLLSGA